MPAITPLPTAPSRDDPTNFSTRADDFLAALPTFANECNAAAVAMTLSATNSTSTTPLVIGLGSKSLTVQTAKSYVVGMTVKISSTASPNNWMLGDITSYVSSTGALVVNVLYTGGSGTLPAWTVSQSLAVATTGDATLTSINGGQLAGFRNKIINGACNVQQRIAATLTGFGATSAYGSVDRFSCGHSGTGGSITFEGTLIIHENTYKNAAILYVNTAATATFTGTNQAKIEGFSQKIECYNVYDLRGKTITISFLFGTSVAGRYSFSLQLLQVFNSYVDTFDVGVGMTKVSFTLSIPTELPKNGTPTETLDPGGGDNAAMKVTIGGLSGTNTGTSILKSWIQGEFVAATGPLTGVTNWANTAYNYIVLTELQLEAGSIATPFEQRPYATELALCQRYYEVNTSPTLAGIRFTAGVYRAHASFKVVKRTVPSSITLINQIGGGSSIQESASAYGFQWGSNNPTSQPTIDGYSASAEL